MRESIIEKKVTDHARQQGWYARKFVSPGVVGVPDRLYLKPIDNPEHRAIVQRYVKWIEFKATGKHPTKKQLREHLRLQTVGHHVDVIDSINEGKDIFNEDR